MKHEPLLSNFWVPINTETNQLWDSMQKFMQTLQTSIKKKKKLILKYSPEVETIEINSKKMNLVPIDILVLIFFSQLVNLELKNKLNVHSFHSVTNCC